MFTINMDLVLRVECSKESDLVTQNYIKISFHKGLLKKERKEMNFLKTSILSNIERTKIATSF